MNNYVDGDNMPLGLGMALAKNVNAMNYFSALSKEQQDAIISHTHEIKSKREMQDYVNNLSNNQSFY